LKEKIENLQEPEDLSFYMSYFDDPSTATATGDKATNQENSPTKKLHLEGNNYANVKPGDSAGGINTNLPNQSAYE